MEDNEFKKHLKIIESALGEAQTGMSSMVISLDPGDPGMAYWFFCEIGDNNQILNISESGSDSVDDVMDLYQSWLEGQNGEEDDY